MHHHKPWRPSPAAKPSHLTSGAGSQSIQSLAALQGAASAFAAKPRPTTPTVNQLRNQYEIKPDVHGSETVRGRHPRQSSDESTKKDVQRSPSRGRHLSPDDAVLAGARSAISSASPPTSASLDKSSSMIAARLASNSPSPVRGVADASPPQNDSKFMRSAIESKTLDFDNIPRLVQRQTAQSSHETSREPMSTMKSTTKTAPIQIPLAKSPEQLPLSARDMSPAMASDSPSMRSKPPTPAPRKGRPLVRSPLQADLTGSKQFQGLSREEVINRMADAMVASSLASTRPPSPSKATQTPSPLRRSASAHNTYRIPPVEPTPLPTHYKPQKPMKQTLRKASPEEEDTFEPTKRGRRHLVRKHPNMHHEGDRKRWRDKVSEMERKRYEGVFAANRGLLLKSADSNTSPSRLMDPSAEGNQVVNVVVRDIWERSRLPAHILEQVYDLVAPDEAPVLNRQQFVVGLWLIDQKLKGRKLPIRVSESVWASVRHSQGIKIGNQSSY